jgi:itaconyl-CoA hydratase
MSDLIAALTSAAPAAPDAAHLTSADNFFEDFVVGEVFRHQRGRTIMEFDNVALTLMMMNTAQPHFNEAEMAASEFGTRITFGGVVASFVLGLASQDTAEQAVLEVGLDRVRFMHPVRHGDTLYAYTKVLERSGPFEREGVRVGELLFRHYGINQDDHVVAEIDRRALLRCRPHGS